MVFIPSHRFASAFYSRLAAGPLLEEMERYTAGGVKL
jgi:hypothetical protein